jgi:hypothetical protein
VTSFHLKLAALSLVTLGMEWTFHFWRKFRHDPASTVFDEVDSAVQMLRQRNLLILGSAAGAVAVLYGGTALLYFGWNAMDLGDLLARGSLLTTADWKSFSSRAVPGIIIWGIAASALSEKMHHPFFPANVAQLLGVVGRIGVAFACVWTGYACYLGFNYHLIGALIGIGVLAMVAVSTWTGGLGRWSKDSASGDEDPAITTAAHYPLSYVCLSTFFLLFGYVFLTGKPS